MRLEGQKGSAPVVIESKFYSSCYMSPLKDFKQKAKKKKRKVSFTWCPQCLA